MPTRTPMMNQATRIKRREKILADLKAARLTTREIAAKYILGEGYIAALRVGAGLPPDRYRVK